MASRTARGSRSGIVVVRGRDNSPSDRNWELGKERKRIPCENDILADAAYGMAADDATRAEIETGGKTNLRLAGANDVSTVRPTGAITGRILQSLRLYLVVREPRPSVSVTF